MLCIPFINLLFCTVTSRREHSDRVLILKGWSLGSERLWVCLVKTFGHGKPYRKKPIAKEKEYIAHWSLPYLYSLEYLVSLCSRYYCRSTKISLCKEIWFSKHITNSELTTQLLVWVIGESRVIVSCRLKILQPELGLTRSEPRKSMTSDWWSYISHSWDQDLLGLLLLETQLWVSYTWR